ncbi:TRAP transporter small permease [Shimia sp.]|uniref:TRAP transporter small permease subunit n=1 Tax=Shimia sp. TaxID=1954381 RepID=UPI003298E8E4
MWLLNTAVTSLNSLGTILIMAMMAMICADVLSRNLLGQSLPGVIELAELGIVSIVYLQIADTYKSGKMLRSDGIITALEGRFPRLGLAINAVFDATGVVLFFYIAKGAQKRFIEAWEGGFYLGNQGSFTAPTWPMELIVAVGSALLSALFLASVIRNLARLFGVSTTGTTPHAGSPKQ